MILDLASLETTILLLDEGLVRYTRNTSDTLLLDGLLLRFKTNYDLAHKSLKKYLESTAPKPALIDQMSFQDLIRTGNKSGLLKGDWLDWKQYREMRTQTSHAYDDTVASQIVEGIPKFLGEVQYLRDSLRARTETV